MFSIKRVIPRSGHPTDLAAKIQEVALAHGCEVDRKLRKKAGGLGEEVIIITHPNPPKELTEEDFDMLFWLSTETPTRLP